jgi:phosphatidate cytidylyltransferase
MAVTGVGPELLWMSVATAMAAQAGDLAESAVKRGAGVKDASNILPGHGGLLDRFDGMMGAGLFVLVMHPLAGFPPAAATAAGG